ncbi:hypothetical protein V8V91_17805 [Algoriphagus halophilus]|uniref:hypothetical protein n=1 Tax=Algoriphagus halophilus TaxID=226505 RepID=UPI00358E3B82
MSSNEQIKLESYLALKYGITLDQSVANYVNSSGTVLWNNTSYWNDVFGIGKDDASTLNQPRSNSINTGSGDGTPQTGKANILIENPSSLDNGDFLIIGHDNGNLAEQTTDLPASLSRSSRLSREWKVRQTGDVGTFSLKINLGGITLSNTQASQLKLLVNETGTGDFTTGTFRVIDATDFTSDDNLVFDDITLKDGEVFTVLIEKSFAFSDANLWLKTEVGVASKAVNSTLELTKWEDQTAINDFTTLGKPIFLSDEVNFNNAVSFSNVTSSGIPENGLVGSSPITAVEVMAVFKHKSLLEQGTILGGDIGEEGIFSALLNRTKLIDNSNNDQFLKIKNWILNFLSIQLI